MTWSLIAINRERGWFGVAVASRAFAVGSLVPYVRSGAGAIATQALLNPLYGSQGLDLLAAGASADDVVRELCAEDVTQQRQLHIMDRDGRFSAYTGSACIDWFGHHVGKDYSVAGNTLAGPEVVERTAQTFESLADVPLPRRMILAMQAGEAAGGDKRGRQAAGLIVHDDQPYPLVDIRVDDHPSPLEEMERLEVVGRSRFQHYRKFMPSTSMPSGISDHHELERLIEESKRTDEALR